MGQHVEVEFGWIYPLHFPFPSSLSGIFTLVHTKKWKYKLIKIWIHEIPTGLIWKIHRVKWIGILNLHIVILVLTHIIALSCQLWMVFWFGSLRCHLWTVPLRDSDMTLGWGWGRRHTDLRTIQCCCCCCCCC